MEYQQKNKNRSPSGDWLLPTFRKRVMNVQSDFESKKEYIEFRRKTVQEILGMPTRLLVPSLILYVFTILVMGILLNFLIR